MHTVLQAYAVTEPAVSTSYCRSHSVVCNSGRANLFLFAKYMSMSVRGAFAACACHDNATPLHPSSCLPAVEGMFSDDEKHETLIHTRLMTGLLAADYHSAILRRTQHKQFHLALLAGTAWATSHPAALTYHERKKEKEKTTLLSVIKEKLMVNLSFP